MAIGFSRLLRSPASAAVPLPVKRVQETVWRWQDKITSVGDAVSFIKPAADHFMNTHTTNQKIKGLFNRHVRSTQILEALYDGPKIPSIVSKRTLDHPAVNPWFRGVANKNWDLTPSFQRIAQGNNKRGCVLDETHALNDIVSNYPELRKMSFFDALATLQHYTFPTRLLDWSTNPLNALFFCCIDMQGEIDTENDGELFILNPLKLNYYTCSRWGILHPEHKEVIMRLRLALSTDYRSFSSSNNFNDPSDLFFASQMGFNYEEYKETRKSSNIGNWDVGRLLATPIAVYPTRNNDRLIMQEGTFTLHGGKVYHEASKVDDSLRLPKPMTLEEMQSAVFSSEARDAVFSPEGRGTGDSDKKFKSNFIASLTVPGNEKHKILTELEQYGITFDKLLPELDYVAKAVRSAWMVETVRKIDETFPSPTGRTALTKEPLTNVDKLPVEQREPWRKKHEALKGLITDIRNRNISGVEKTLDDQGFAFFGENSQDEGKWWPSAIYEISALGLHTLLKKVLDKGEKEVKEKKISRNDFNQVINSTNTQRWTPLYGAILYKRSNCALELLRAGALRKIDGDNLQNSMISLIVRHENTSKIRDLVQAFYPRPSKDQQPPSNAGEKAFRADKLHPAANTVFGLSPIHYACEIGSEIALRTFLAYHRTLNVYQKNPLGRTPLQVACLNGYDDLVKDLIDESRERSIDLDINYRTPYGRSALDFVLFATSLRNKDEDLFTAIKQSPFFRILEILRNEAAEVIDINSFKTKEFREIMACVREIISERDVYLKEDTKNQQDYIQRIKDLLGEDQTLIDKAIAGLSDQAKAIQESLKNLTESGGKPGNIDKRYHVDKTYLEEIIKETKTLIEEIAPSSETKKKSSEKAVSCFGYKFQKNYDRLRQLILLIKKLKIIPHIVKSTETVTTKEIVPDKEIIKINDLLEIFSKELQSIISTRAKYLSLNDKGFSILSYLVRINEKDSNSSNIIRMVNSINPDAIQQVSTEKNGWNIPLLEACSFGASNSVDTLCELGVKIYTPIGEKEKCDGKSPIMLAAWSFRPTLLKKLIEQLDKDLEKISADENARRKLKRDFLDMRNIHDHTALSLVVMNSELLHLPKGTKKPHEWNKWTEALEEVLFEIVDILCKNGANVKGKYPGIYHHDNSILNLAAALGAPTKVFDRLIEGLTIEDGNLLLNGVNSIGEAPIHSAADYGKWELLKNWFEKHKTKEEGEEKSKLVVDMEAKTLDGRTIQDLMRPEDEHIDETENMRFLLKLNEDQL